MKIFKDKVVLVTGESSGIGRTSALAFAKEGAKVIIADINVLKAEETVQRIKQSNGQAVFF